MAKLQLIMQRTKRIRVRVRLARKLPNLLLRTHPVESDKLFDLHQLVGVLEHDKSFHGEALDQDLIRWNWDPILLGS